MKRDFVERIKENDQVKGVFLVKEKVMATSKEGAPFLKVKLADRTGEIEGRIWEGVEETSKLFKKGDFILIEAQAVTFQDRLQLRILTLEPYPSEEVDLEDFLPKSPRPPEEMLEELRRIALMIREPFLFRLVFSFLEDEDFLRLFIKAPASRRLHHARIGGLLEHTLSVVKLVERIRGHYEEVNWDLLLAGAILHDVGKVRELGEGLLFDYTDEGRLLGHILLGLEMVQEKISSIPGFPEDLAMLIKHLIASHHGQYEWGSPKRPKTLEAELLHQLDNLDAKVTGIAEFIRRRGQKGEWTEYHRLFERFFYRGKEESLREGL